MKQLASFALSMLLVACSGGGESVPADGTVSVVLTDNTTDELTQFEVDVENITLQRPSGESVRVMPRATRVDFLQLGSISELVAARSLRPGAYERITLTLDFSTAEIFVVGETSAATVLDENGDPITGKFDVDIDLRSGGRPLIRTGRGALLVLDLDLEQSVTVDAGSNTVTFAPVWSVEADPETPKPVATTGVLDSVDLQNRLVYVERRARDGSAIRVFAVRTTAATIFQLNGVVLVGDAGLGTLATHLGERLFVQGSFERDDGVLVAAAIESGTGVPGNGQDWVYGHVIARSGGAGGDATLTVLGRSRDYDTTARTYNTVHTVDVSFANTKVLRRGEAAALGSDAINVGQRVWIFGELDGTDLEATGEQDVARLLRTAIFGVADGPASNDTITVDVQRFGWRDIARFDFDVSGQVQADPNAFVIDVAGLSTGAITNGSQVRALGWIGPVDAAGPDAEAIALADRTNGAKLLMCRWAPPTSGVLDASGAVLEIDVSEAISKAVGGGFGPTALTNTPAPTIAPLLPVGFYRIVQQGGVTFFSDYDAFRDAVDSRIASAAVKRVMASGIFDSAEQRMAALSATVVLR